MKIRIFLLSATLFTFPVISQTYSWISSYYYNYIEVSIEYTRISTTNSLNYGSVLATKQAQYDVALQEINAVYSQMSKLQLLNKSNRKQLNDYRDKYFKEIADDAAKLDLSIDSNKNWAIKAFKTPVLDSKYIRNEIKILNRIGKEINFLEYDAPRFNKEQIGDINERKKNVVNFLIEWENVDPDNAQQLLKNYKLDLIMFGDFLE